MESELEIAERVKKERLLIEALAKHSHDTWANSVYSQIRSCVINNDGSLEMSEETILQLFSQIDTPYSDLSIDEKYQYQKEAVEIINIFEHI